MALPSRPRFGVCHLRVSIVLFAGLMILLDATSPISAQQPSGPGNTSAPAPREKTCSESFSQRSTADFNTKCVALAGPLAAMRGETLVLRMDSGSRRVFDNKNGDGAGGGGFGYGLADFYPSMQ